MVNVFHVTRCVIDVFEAEGSCECNVSRGPAGGDGCTSVCNPQVSLLMRKQQNKETTDINYKQLKNPYESITVVIDYWF